MKTIPGKSIVSFLKNRNNLLVIILTGVLLMVISIPTDSGKKGEKTGINSKNNGSYGAENTDSETTQEAYGNADGDFLLAQEAYVKEMEAKAEKLLSGVSGAGQVKVMLTIEASSEKIVEKDMPVSRSQTTEQDNQGGSRMVSEFTSEEDTVYRKENGTEVPFVIKTVSPQVEGVVVVAEGAGNGEVSRNLSEAVQVLFGVEAHRVKVLAAGNS